MSTTVGKNKDKYQVNFYNENTKKNKTLKGMFNTIEEADIYRSEYELDFYSKNTHLLPKGVTAGKTSFALRVKCYTITNPKGTVKNIASAKTLTEIKKLKIKCLVSLIG